MYLAVTLLHKVLIYKYRIVHPTWVDTPLIQGLKAVKGFNEFVLDADTVAEAIVGQILKGESAQLILPGRFGWLSSVRAWPGWAQTGLRDSIAGFLPSDGH